MTIVTVNLKEENYGFDVDLLHVCVQIPINRCPFAKVQTYARDGLMNVSDNGGSKPNYYPNSFEDLPRPDPAQPDVHPYK